MKENRIGTTYNKEYYETHKEQYKRNNMKWINKNKEHIKEYHQKYYQENKEDIYKKNREYQANHKEQFSKLCQKSRRKRVDLLREQGVTNAWDVVVKGAKPKFIKEENK